MNAFGSLRAALVDGYRQSWRLVLLNCAVAAVLGAAAFAATLALPAALLVLAAGPLAAALAHCAVIVARTRGDLDWADVFDGLRLHWRRGFALAAIGTFGTALGVVAVRFYATRNVWFLVAVTAYILAAFWLWQLLTWPLAVSEPDRPLRAVLREAARELVRRPASAMVLGLVLLVVNVAGAASVAPMLTLTLAYSFLAAAHFVLPPDLAPEA